ncbi:RICIN domain-containing protein [Corallococcus exiguus]|uniref:RICIN domain-containing protein n=1 Tax=Corallococcus exiguus TaxID=83462 RepID=UPI00155F6696|nr:RICIN domain-containing protein [Corallococcus exiguus]
MSRTSTPFRTWALGAVFLASLGGCSGAEDAPAAGEPVGQVEAAALSTRVVGYLPTWAGDVNTLQYSKLSQDTSGSTSLLNAVYSVAQGTGGGTGAYRLVNKASGRCVDINGPSTADGAIIHQWACHTGTSQQWSMEATDSGYYRFVSRHSGKALDVKDVSTADGAGLQQWSYGGGSNPQFKPVDLGNGYVRLEARHSGKVLDVTGCLQGSGDGTLLQQWTWSNNDCQQFNLEAL